MAFIVEEDTGNIILVQGDSGKYPVEDVPNDKHYKAYFSIYNEKRKTVGFEVNIDIPAYNSGQIVYDNDLYCWSHSFDSLYTLRESPYVNDTLYDIDNEATEYTVTSINSIVTEDGSYTRDTEHNINEYEINYYAWIDEEDTVLYTEDEYPLNHELCDENGDGTGLYVVSDDNLAAWEDNGNNVVYTLTEAISVNDYIYDEYGKKVTYLDSGYGYISDINNNTIGVTYPVDEQHQYYQRYIRINSKDTIFITDDNSPSVSYTRSEENDIKTLVSVIAYAWNDSSNLIYTVNENPVVGDITYNYEQEADKTITSIGSILIGEDEFLRNTLSDIKKTDIPDIPPTTLIEFNIPASLTDFLKVPVTEETATYYFGIKLCDDYGGEDTLLLGNSNIGDLNTITVYPKKVEGTISNG